MRTGLGSARELSRPRAALVAVGVAVAVALAVVLAFSPGGGSNGERVEIEPSDALLDAPFRVAVGGADDAGPVRLTLSATAADGLTWTSTRLVEAGASGEASLDGGPLLAALAPVGADDPTRVWLLPEGEALDLRLEARVGERTLGRATATRRMIGDGVASRELTVARDAMVGRFWTGPAADRRRVAVLVLGGSEGGLRGSAAAGLLASHGYPVLQLAYFRAPGLPARLRNIPLEYLQRALEWLRSRPGVERAVVVGASRGGELALLLGSTYPALVQGVVAYAPAAAVVPGSWTLRGTPVPPSSNPDPRIPVERIRGPLLVVAGGADQVWNAAYAASAIRARRLAHGRNDTEALTFERAGHAVTLAVPYLSASTEVEVDGFTLSSGGTRTADALARTASWPRLLALLDRVDR